MLAEKFCVAFWDPDPDVGWARWRFFPVRALPTAVAPGCTDRLGEIPGRGVQGAHCHGAARGLHHAVALWSAWCPLWSTSHVVRVVVPGVRRDPPSIIPRGQPRWPLQGNVELIQIRQWPLHHEVVLLKMAEQIAPQRGLLSELLPQHFGVTTNHQAQPGTSKSNVQTSRIIEKPNALILIGSHTREQNEVLLTALKSVD
mmetsp:Transcript_70780/g.162267  ORF Transcript_70780/g.162267 Transcript_70780/m.162267 type:complete len:200 (-) Transcript_70780:2444-3043(-)